MNLDEEKRYCDAQAKGILSQKKFIAPLLQRILPGYENLTLEEIQKRLPGEGQVIDLKSQEPINPSFKQSRVDLIFPLKKSVYRSYPGTILDVEVQSSMPTRRLLEVRACTYLDRIFAEQKTDYNELASVFTIWIIFDDTYLDETFFYNLSYGLTGRELRSEKPVYLEEPRVSHQILYEEVATNPSYASPNNIIFIRLGKRSNPLPGTVGAYLKDLFLRKYRNLEEIKETMESYSIKVTREELEMIQENTSFADAMIDIGISEGEERRQSKIDNQIDEALKIDPTMSLAEFKKQFLKEKKEN